MANQITNAFEKQYSAEVHAVFSQKGTKLKQHVRNVSGVKGSTFSFHKMGSVIANGKSRDADVTPVNPTQTVAVATLEDAYAAIYMDKLDEVKSNASIRKGYVDQSARALGRKVDSLIIGGLDASTPGTVIPVASSGLTLTKILDTLEALNANDVDPEDRIMVVSASALSDVLAEDKLTNADYQTMQGLTTGTIQSALGFTWVIHTGLTLNTTTRSCYAFSKSAVGLAIGQDLMTEVSWIPEKVSTLVNSYLSMGSTVIDESGVVEIQVAE